MAYSAQWSLRWQQYDIILTTYGTLRSDLSTIKNIEFDYVILDESQAIKIHCRKYQKQYAYYMPKTVW
jgi:SNF2 family DNA or RNA helicase